MVDKTWPPERWDIGLWDSATWDGQIGFPAETAAVTITPQDVTFTLGFTTEHFVLTTEMVTVWIAPQQVSLNITWAPTPQPGAIRMGIPKYFVDRW